MKIEVNAPEKSTEPKYPYLGQSANTKLTVWFTAPCCGIVLIPDATYDEGEYLEDWIETSFNRLPVGTKVTLTQT